MALMFLCLHHVLIVLFFCETVFCALSVFCCRFSIEFSRISPQPPLVFFSPPFLPSSSSSICHAWFSVFAARKEAQREAEEQAMLHPPPPPPPPPPVFKDSDVQTVFAESVAVQAAVGQSFGTQTSQAPLAETGNQSNCISELFGLSC